MDGQIMSILWLLLLPPFMGTMILGVFYFAGRAIGATPSLHGWVFVMLAVYSMFGALVGGCWIIDLSAAGL